MANISSKQTIVVIISLVGAIALAQAAVGWLSLGEVHKEVTYLSQNSLPTLLKISEIESAAMQAQMLVAEQTASISAADHQAKADALKTVLASTDKLLEAYQPMIVDQGDQDAYDGVVSTWKAWQQAAQKVETAAVAGDLQAATTAYGAQETGADAFAKALAAMSDDKVMNSNDEADAADSAVQVAKLWVMVLMVAVLLGSAIAIVVAIRRVLNPLGDMTASMQRLAHGELDAEIPHTARRDEIGEMAAAVKVFQVNAVQVRELNAAETIRTGQTRERAAAMSGLVDGLATVVTSAVAGDFAQRISLKVADADLNSVADNVNQLLTTVDAAVTETGQVLAALAATDLTLHVNGAYQGAFAKLKDDTNAVVDNISAVVGQLRHTSGSLKSATSEILVGANDLAERTTRQAAAVEETSAAMEQLSTTVAENAKRADQASRKAQIVSDTAALTGQVMNRSNEAMERITTSSSKISNIIGLIDDVAFQTNLLALNASVEAARAGDAGKGFAVVAVEVRRLAQSAASASSEVKALIEQSAGEVSAGSKLVAEASQKLSEMLGSVTESAQLIKDISTASHEQSSAIAEVSTAIRQMDEMTQHNAALLEQTNAAIEQTENQATELDLIVDRFVVKNAGDHPGKRLAA